jgi:hypothetical protein
MTAPAIAPEIVTRTALLGVRFWDSVTGRAVALGLTLAEPRSGTKALPNASGVFVLHDLPGLRASAFGAGDPVFWASPPAHRQLVLEITDARRRFISFRFGADAPSRGLLDQYCPSASPPGSGVGDVPLFSSPARAVHAGTAAVRADLWDAVADRGAAWALLEVSSGGQVHRGVADADGRVVVLLPYPEPQAPLTSPPAGEGALSAQTWPVSVAVRYSPQAASPPAVGGRQPGTEPPDLCAVLGQDTATPLDAASPPTPLGPRTLVFGRDLVLRSAGQSVLLVTPP